MMIQAQIEALFKQESGRVLATLVRLLNDFDAAEEALQETFAAALEQWPRDGIPANPSAWLISTGKYKAIDTIRRADRGREIAEQHVLPGTPQFVAPEFPDDGAPRDDRLRLIFFCCHPTLPLDARIALSLRDVCGMSTAAIARAYLLPAETVKKRIVRAKTLFKSQDIPYEIPAGHELPQRLNAVLHVIYLIFNEGYAASSGADHIRRELSDEAIFLCRTLVELSPAPETLGLLALLLLQEARRTSRVNASGDVIPLEEQDRSLWNQDLIREGLQLIQRAIMSGRLGPYTLQAAIASVHATADSMSATRWDTIVEYYDLLLKTTPSAIVKLNRAIAVGMDQGPDAGLKLTDELLDETTLKSYHLLYAARADFYVRLQQPTLARKSYLRALELAGGGAEQRYLKQQIAQLPE